MQGWATGLVRDALSLCCPRRGGELRYLPRGSQALGLATGGAALPHLACSKFLVLSLAVPCDAFRGLEHPAHPLGELLGGEFQEGPAA